METSKISVVVPESYDPAKPIVIQILEGQAPAPVKTLHPQKITISGDITAPINFAKDRFLSNEVGEIPQYSRIPEDNKKAIVTYMDKSSGPWIKLETDPTSELNTIVTGKLLQNPDLAPFQFNKPGVFDNESFIEVLRKYAHCFKDIEQVKTLIKQLQNFVAKFETEVEKLDDKLGNTKNSVRTALNASKSGIPTDLDFSMPLFSGGGKVNFTALVEIEVEFNGGKSPKAMFGLFSLDLQVNLTETAFKITQEQVSELEKYFTCIRVES